MSGNVDINTPGTYNIIYTATDAAGNSGTGSRTVVVESSGPIITANSYYSQIGQDINGEATLDQVDFLYQ